MTKKNRTAAFLMALVLLSVMLFSSLSIMKNAGHDCTGNGCPICEQMEACENMLHSVSLAVTAAAVTVFAFLLCTVAEKPAVMFLSSDTLVSLRVKLSD